VDVSSHIFLTRPSDMHLSKADSVQTCTGYTGFPRIES